MALEKGFESSLLPISPQYAPSLAAADPGSGTDSGSRESVGGGKSEASLVSGMEECDPAVPTERHTADAVRAVSPETWYSQPLEMSQASQMLRKAQGPTEASEGRPVGRRRSSTLGALSHDAITRTVDAQLERQDGAPSSIATHQSRSEQFADADASTENVDVDGDDTIEIGLEASIAFQEALDREEEEAATTLAAAAIASAHKHTNDDFSFRSPAPIVDGRKMTLRKRLKRKFTNLLSPGNSIPDVYHSTGALSSNAPNRKPAAASKKHARMLRKVERAHGLRDSQDNDESSSSDEADDDDDDDDHAGRNRNNLDAAAAAATTTSAPQLAANKSAASSSHRSLTHAVSGVVDFVARSPEMIRRKVVQNRRNSLEDVLDADYGLDANSQVAKERPTSPSGSSTRTPAAVAAAVATTTTDITGASSLASSPNKALTEQLSKSDVFRRQLTKKLSSDMDKSRRRRMTSKAASMESSHATVSTPEAAKPPLSTVTRTTTTDKSTTTTTTVMQGSNVIAKQVNCIAHASSTRADLRSSPTPPHIGHAVAVESTPRSPPQASHRTIRSSSLDQGVSTPPSSLSTRKNSADTIRDGSRGTAVSFQPSLRQSSLQQKNMAWSTPIPESPTEPSPKPRTTAKTKRTPASRSAAATAAAFGTRSDSFLHAIDDRLNESDSFVPAFVPIDDDTGIAAKYASEDETDDNDDVHQSAPPSPTGGSSTSSSLIKTFPLRRLLFLRKNSAPGNVNSGRILNSRDHMRRLGTPPPSDTDHGSSDEELDAEALQDEHELFPKSNNNPTTSGDLAASSQVPLITRGTALSPVGHTPTINILTPEESSTSYNHTSPPVNEQYRRRHSHAPASLSSPLTAKRSNVSISHEDISATDTTNDLSNDFSHLDPADAYAALSPASGPSSAAESHSTSAVSSAVSSRRGSNISSIMAHQARQASPSLHRSSRPTSSSTTADSPPPESPTKSQFTLPPPDHIEVPFDESAPISSPSPTPERSRTHSPFDVNQTMDDFLETSLYASFGGDKIKLQKKKSTAIVETSGFSARLLERVSQGKASALLHISALTVAQLITAEDRRIFYAIEPSEFDNCGWSKATKQTHSANIVASIAFFNSVSDWVNRELSTSRSNTSSSAVTSQSLPSLASAFSSSSSSHPLSEKTRVSLFKFFIRVALACRLYQNFSSLMAITAAMETVKSRHVNFSPWSKLPSKYQIAYDELRSVVSYEHNFALLRRAVRDTDQPAVPYLGIFLMDVTRISDGIDQKSKLEKHNLIKLALAPVTRLQKLQSLALPIAIDAQLQRALLTRCRFPSTFGGASSPSGTKITAKMPLQKQLLLRSTMKGQSLDDAIDLLNMERQNSTSIA